MSYYARKELMGDINIQANIPCLPKKYDALTLTHGSTSVILQYPIKNIVLKRPGAYRV